MGHRLHRFHVAVAAFAAATLFGGLSAIADGGMEVPPEAATAGEATGGSGADRPDADGLDASFAQLAAPGDGWRRAESDILRAWSRSGSAAMDYLRLRGEQALDAGDVETAIGHLTALTDHAPDYAEGFQLRAAAFAMAERYGPAAADLARTLQLEPRHFIALTQLGSLLEDMGATTAALDAFEASLAIHPHQQEAIDAVARLTRIVDGVAL